MTSKSNGEETYYDVLRLKSNCSAQDIKSSFIKLSKEFHPDRNSGEKEKDFVKVNEAYSVLSKAVTRREYDNLLEMRSCDQKRVYHQYYDNVYSTRDMGRGGYDHNQDESFWDVRKRKGNIPNAGPFYSIKGIKKMSNSMIVVLCCVLTVVGAGVQFFAIRESTTLNREKLRLESARNNMLLEYARNQATENGIEEQIRKFMSGELQGADMRKTTEEFKKFVQQEEGKK